MTRTVFHTFFSEQRHLIFPALYDVYVLDFH
jgi:hypothetical protein